MDAGTFLQQPFSTYPSTALGRCASSLSSTVDPLARSTSIPLHSHAPHAPARAAARSDDARTTSTKRTDLAADMCGSSAASRFGSGNWRVRQRRRRSDSTRTNTAEVNRRSGADILPIRSLYSYTVSTTSSAVLRWECTRAIRIALRANGFHQKLTPSCGKIK